VVGTSEGSGLRAVGENAPEPRGDRLLSLGVSDAEREGDVLEVGGASLAPGAQALTTTMTATATPLAARAI
jgi:hypothetical protein